MFGGRKYETDQSLSSRHRPGRVPILQTGSMRWWQICIALNLLARGRSPQGLTFNHFLITGDEPLLFHGEAKKVSVVYRCRCRIMHWSGLRLGCAFGHLKRRRMRIDERMASRRRPPSAELMHGVVGWVSINDMADRTAPRSRRLARSIEIGGKTSSLHSKRQCAKRMGCRCYVRATTEYMLRGDLLHWVGGKKRPL